MAHTPSDFIHCMLVPLQKYYLLLPNTTIAEVLPMPNLLAPDSPVDYFVGHCEWRENTISVINLEKLIGQQFTDTHSAKKLCILNGINTAADIKFYALPCYGAPQLITLNQSALQITHEIDAP